MPMACIAHIVHRGGLIFMNPAHKRPAQGAQGRAVMPFAHPYMNPNASGLKALQGAQQ